MFSCRPEKEAKQKQQIPGKKIIKIGIIIMKLFILASALMLVLVFSSYVSADDPSDLDTAESQASFGYGYGTKVSNFMSNSEFMIKTRARFNPVNRVRFLYICRAMGHLS